ncbi:hypothetical protein OSB04_004037 [Centaurea solstitialis]|uniref:Uncharacterized protein n=1 Tax=Centaurea solstitialis TaxID=347529 RepID=A0AA38WVV1_9ASTR|nr:hypothetical protein OSB04_004037 [Centaurea solstitialis]
MSSPVDKGKLTSWGQWMIPSSRFFMCEFISQIHESYPLYQHLIIYHRGGGLSLWGSGAVFFISVTFDCFHVETNVCLLHNGITRFKLYQQFGQRLPVLPSPPLPPFQQGPPASQHPITQQGRPSIPPHAGQAAPPPYSLASSASMQLGPPVSVPPSGMLSSSQSYLIPPPPPPPQGHVSTSTPHSYSVAPQNSNWNQNQHISPPIPPPGHHLTPRIPPPHLQGQHFYRVPAPSLPPVGIRGIQQAPPLLPPPPTSSYFTPASFGSFAQPAHESSLGHLPPPPPPPPSSPPPGPPPLPPLHPLPFLPFVRLPNLSQQLLHLVQLLEGLLL